MASSRGSRSPDRSGTTAVALAALLAACGSLIAQQGEPAGATKQPDAQDEQARPADEPALFAMFAKLEQLRASYTEEKHLSLLAVPLKSKGQLCYLKRGYLSRIVAEPEPSRLTITPTELRMQNAEGTEVVDLRQSDRVRLFVTSLLQVFRGDRDALGKHYRVRYSPVENDDARWQLELVPEQEQLKPILKRLVLHGKGRGVERIVLEEPNGDRTVTTIVAARTDRPFSAEEKRELFGIEADDDGGDDAAKRR